LVPATQILGFAASGIETLIEIMLQVRKRPVDAPLHHGRSAERYSLPDFWKPRRPAAARLFWFASRGRYAAAATFLIGALLSRYAWIWRAVLRPATFRPCFNFSANPKKRICTGEGF